MKRTFSLVLILFVVFWSACGKSQKPESKATAEVIDGIECIHNTETPLHPDKTVAFEEELSIGGEDADGNITLFEPTFFAVDDNENIYISERQDQVIKVYGFNGKYIKTIGAKGSGPGEFQMISSLALTKDGKLVVTDQRANRTSFFDSSGRFLKSFQWHKGQYNFILIKSSSYVYGERAYSGTRQFGFFYVKEIDFDGKEIGFYGEFTMVEPLIVRHSDGGITYTGLPVSRRSIFIGDKDRECFYHCLNNKYIIEVYDTSGTLFRKIDRPYEPVPFTDKDAEKYRARFENIPSEVLRKAVRDLEMPKVKNVVSRMHVDSESNLWIRTNEIKEEEDKILTAYDIFDSDGYYYAKVWTPVLPFLFKDGTMYRMDIDSDTGYRTIKRYRVVWQ